MVGHKLVKCMNIAKWEVIYLGRKVEGYICTMEIYIQTVKDS